MEAYFDFSRRGEEVPLKLNIAGHASSLPRICFFLKYLELADLSGILNGIRKGAEPKYRKPKDTQGQSEAWSSPCRKRGLQRRKDSQRKM